MGEEAAGVVGRDDIEGLPDRGDEGVEGARRGAAGTSP